ncbi:hypothetical protein E4U21_005746 [Claviceps maximensis]|nr:hypothetical protein E4U21_005746 [Claviceps maximensis]
MSSNPPSAVPDPPLFAFPSRRSVVHSTDGIVACTQPLAAKCGLDVLRAGGNAADAAVAVAAGLNLTEPCSTGIGGDMFILFYDASTKKVQAMNGSGRAGRRCTVDAVCKDLGIPDHMRARAKIPVTSVHTVTVPGAAAAWVDTVERFGSGRVDMQRILAPAIELGEKGFPVSEVSAHMWASYEYILRDASPNFGEMLKKDPHAQGGFRPPRAGEMVKNPTLATTFRTLAEQGKRGFYTGRIAEEIVRIVQSRGGLLEMQDLEYHLRHGSESVEPMSLPFRGQGQGQGGEHDGIRVWEHPPNGQGIVALMALGIIEQLEKQAKIPTFQPSDFNSAPYLHAIIEALKIAFSDGHWFIADPNVQAVPVDGLLSQAYLAERARLFDATRAARVSPLHGDPPSASPALSSSDTVYFAVTDADGNSASVINSHFADFGSGIIPRGCGFTLQSRGASFSLDENHPNSIQPGKRPYHTIIPAMATNLRDGSLHSSFGVIGAFMQPQGHVQVLLGQMVGQLDPQHALDAPRVCVTCEGYGGWKPDDDGDDAGWTIDVEDGIAPDTIDGLKKLGHRVRVISGAARSRFGRGQVIRRVVDAVDGTAVWSAGSDMRGDGAAYPL